MVKLVGTCSSKETDSDLFFLDTGHEGADRVFGFIFSVNIWGVSVKMMYLKTSVLTGKPLFPAEPEIPEKPLRPW